MTASSPSKRPKGERRELVPLEPVDAQDGAAMKGLPSERHRAFVRALYQVKPGHGMYVRAAKLAGFGSPTSTPQSMATIASRLKSDERVIAAISEEDQKHIRGAAPRALRALDRLIETPGHKDHARGIAMVLDRVHPAETISTLKVEHDTTPEFKETAQVLARIAELAAKFCVRLPAPRIIEGQAVENKSQVAS
jgi:hypothetical protein